MIDVRETLLRFGVDMNIRPPRMKDQVVVLCDTCGSSSVMLYKAYTQKTSSLCRNCPAYKHTRSSIAEKSNRSRPSTSKNIEQYSKYLEPIRSGEITFTEIAQKIGVDDSTVCKFYHKHFGLKSKFGGKSFEEQTVKELLVNVFGCVEDQVRYPDSRKRADFFIPSIGFMEYDGSGFWHTLKNSDKDTDDQFRPIRLSSQALFGKEAYIRYTVLNEKTGYCAVERDSIRTEYSVKKLEKTGYASDMLSQCHSLGNCSGKTVFALFHQETMIGVAKFGVPTNPSDKDCLELRRFFVLDGTPMNTESWFLRQCEKQLTGKLVTYVHHNEKGSYLKALGWTMVKGKSKDYDCYKIGNRIYNKRVIWGWAKRKGLVDKFGTTMAKELLVACLGGIKITEPSKIKFEKVL